MARGNGAVKRAKAEADAFELRNVDDAAREAEYDTHVYGNKVVCDTEHRGFPTPQNRSLTEIVLDASEGFIPLWAPNTTLRWRFQRRSMALLAAPAAAEEAIKALIGKAMLAWGDAAPIKLSEDDDLWDFEVVIRQDDRCSVNGCVLASAFFPDAGRHQLVIYPKLFTQSPKEQLDTLAHEIGHIFGLRHFFAQISETFAASEIFGTHRPLSIMNYGNQSELTEDDRSDLRRLYRAVWDRELTDINGTPIRLVRPFSVSGVPLGPRLAVAAAVASY